MKTKAKRLAPSDLALLRRMGDAGSLGYLRETRMSIVSPWRAEEHPYRPEARKLSQADVARLVGLGMLVSREVSVLERLHILSVRAFAAIAAGGVLVSSETISEFPLHDAPKRQEDVS